MHIHKYRQTLVSKAGYLFNTDGVKNEMLFEVLEAQVLFHLAGKLITGRRETKS